MNPEPAISTSRGQPLLEHTFLDRRRLEEQFGSLEQQTETAALGMWVFLATEVMFFGTLFAALGVYRYQYAEAFERASEKLNWMIGGANTLVLLTSSFTIALAVHDARLGRRHSTVVLLVITALFGLLFMGLKGLEYYLDYAENLVPRIKFDPQEWTSGQHLAPDQVPHVELFLLFYWIMTGFHALHVTIGVAAVLIVAVLTWRRNFTGVYYAPVEVLALYWHFVDLVWIFLLPMLYLLGTHRLGSP
jgi:cytochrome c oxidase subunit III